MKNFLEFISRFIILDTASEQALVTILQELKLPKGHLLLKHDSICRHMYFIEKGLTRTFYLKEGKDVTDWFSPENTIACSVVSFFNQQPDRRSIELLEDCVLWAISYDDLERLYQHHHSIERLGRLLSTFGLLEIQKRFDDLHFATASERYRILLNETPSIIQRAPLGNIASYLGITQETLSRIRSQI